MALLILALLAANLTDSLPAAAYEPDTAIRVDPAIRGIQAFAGCEKDGKFIPSSARAVVREQDVLVIRRSCATAPLMAKASLASADGATPSEAPLPSAALPR